MRVDTCVDERTLHELYLPAFERAIVGSQPWTVMSAYNQINGHFCSESAWLLTTLLRERWGFRGVVVSDWGAVKERVHGVACGCDLEPSNAHPGLNTHPYAHPEPEPNPGPNPGPNPDPNPDPNSGPNLDPDPNAGATSRCQRAEASTISESSEPSQAASSATNNWTSPSPASSRCFSPQGMRRQARPTAAPAAMALATAPLRASRHGCSQPTTRLRVDARRRRRYYFATIAACCRFERRLPSR